MIVQECHLTQTKNINEINLCELCNISKDIWPKGSLKTNELEPRIQYDEAGRQLLKLWIRSKEGLGFIKKICLIETE